LECHFLPPQNHSRQVPFLVFVSQKSPPLPENRYGTVVETGAEDPLSDMYALIVKMRKKKELRKI